MTEVYKDIHALRQRFSRLNQCVSAYVVSSDLSSREKNLSRIRKNRIAYWLIAKNKLHSFLNQAIFISVPISTKEKEIYAGIISGEPEKYKKSGRYAIPVKFENRGRPVCTVLGNTLTSFYDGTAPQSKSPVPIKNWSSMGVSRLLTDGTIPDAEELKIVTGILSDPSIESTEKLQLVLARIGQGKFRENVKKRAGYCCDVTHFEDDDLLLASHILPWAKCETKQQRLDADNGLLLSPNLDRLFDRGFITFDSNGAMLVLEKHLPALRQLVPSVFEEHDKLRKKPNSKQQEYLKMHMEIYNLQKALPVSEIPRRKSRSRPRPLRVNE